jgi:hypothetical protein
MRKNIDILISMNLKKYNLRREKGVKKWTETNNIKVTISR